MLPEWKGPASTRLIQGRGGVWNGPGQRGDTSLTRGLRAISASRKVGEGWGSPKRSRCILQSQRRGWRPRRGSATSPELGYSVHSLPATPRLALDTGLGRVTTPERSEKGGALGRQTDGRGSTSPARGCAGPGTPPRVQLGSGKPQGNENREEKLSRGPAPIPMVHAKAAVTAEPTPSAWPELPRLPHVRTAGEAGAATPDDGAEDTALVSGRTKGSRAQV